MVLHTEQSCGTGICGISHTVDKRNRIMDRNEERRNSRRTALLRPIFYFSDTSDKFAGATMLDYCPAGICFQSRSPLTPGERLYIITEEKPDANLYDDSSEAVAGQVVWCRHSAGAHRIGVHYTGHRLSGADKINSLWSHVSVADARYLQ